MGRCGQYTADGNIQYSTGLGYHDYHPTSSVQPHVVKGVESFGHEMLCVGSHGFASGAINALGGDSFGRGFLTGALSSGIGSFAQGVHMNTGLMPTEP